MITDNGKDLITRYLAGYVGQIGDSIAVGIGSAPESASDVNLQFEINSQAIQQVGIDMAARKLIFKATIPQEIAGRIKEVALWSNRQSIGSLADHAITLVDSATEAWTGGTWATGSRINGSTRQISAAASSSAGASPEVFTRDLSSFTARDEIVIAYEVVSNVASLRIDIGSDGSNRYNVTIDNPPAGYNISKIPLGNFAKVGNPNWAAATYLAVVVTAKSAGPGVVKLDGIRVNRAVPNGTLVSRKVLAQEIIKERNAPLDIEYELPVTI